MNISTRITLLSQVISNDELTKGKSIVGKISESRSKILKKIIEDDSVDQLSNAELRMLSRLENQLLDKFTLLSIEGKYADPSGADNIAAYKRYIFVKALFDIGLRELSLYYAKRLLKEAQSCHLDDLTLLTSEFIEYYYSFVSYDLKKAKEYSKIYEKALKTISTKRKVSKLYYELVNKVVKNKGFFEVEERIRFETRIKNEIPEIEPNMNSSVAQRIFSNYYFYYLLVHDYEELRNISNSALDFYKINYPNIKVQLFMFRLRRAVASIYLKDYKSAREDFIYLAKINITEGALHWNSLWSYYFTLEMLSNNYQKAGMILMNMTSNKAMTKLGDIWLQQWRIRSAYINFLSKIGYVDLSESGKRRVPNFKLGKFLNEVPHYSKDKRGMNISILIAQFIILLAEKKYSKLIDRTEALDKYSYRHLKNDQNLRSNCFIRMLLALVKADFNPIRAKRYAEKYVKRLNFTEINLNEYSAEIEIIPYEELWEIILDITKPLQRKRA